MASSDNGAAAVAHAIDADGGAAASASDSAAAALLLSEAELAGVQAVQRADANEQDEQIRAQMSAIEEDAKSKPLIGAVESIGALEAEYANNPVFLRKVQAAKEEGATLRRVRGDGNCFYRAYVFGILEWMARTLRDESSDAAERSEATSVLERVRSSLAQLLEVGYDSFTMEEFHEYFLELFQWAVDDKPTAEQIRERIAADEGLDLYVVSYARYLTSGQLKRNEQQYVPFVTEGRSIDEFRRTEVEPMHRESDFLCIVALTSLLQVGVRISYLDQSAPGGSSGSSGSDAMSVYVFPEGSAPRVQLLYRPGHYDVLYSRGK